MKKHIIGILFYTIFIELLNAQPTVWLERSGPTQLYNVNSMVITSDNVLIAFGFGKIARSTDGGNNWLPVQLYDAPPGTLISLTQLTSFNNEIYAATYNKGVYKSVDGGINWIKMNNGLLDSDLYSIYASSEGVLFTGTMAGKIYKSIDHGGSWVSLNAVSGDAITTISDEINGNIFIGNYYGIYRSTDKGTVWKKCDSSITNVYEIKIHSNGSIFVGASNGVFRSTDHGETWKSLLSSAEAVRTISIAKDNSILLGKARVCLNQ